MRDLPTSSAGEAAPHSSAREGAPDRQACAAIETCPACDAPVRPEHAHGRCSRCHAMVYTCCDGV